ncbi:sensor histidine kinase [Sphingopyxis sp. LARHCG72]
MTKRATSLRRRIVTSFLATVAIICLLFGFFGFLIAYAVEDSLFEDTLRDEIAFQQAHWQRNQTFSRPARDYLALYRTPRQFPSDLRAAFARAPRQREYFGTEGRYYHVERFTLPRGGGRAFAVAEVSRHLVVRPIRGEILRFLGAWSLAILLIAGGIGYWLAVRATAPLTRLAAKVSERGPNEVPRIAASDFPDNEIGTLARSLEQAFETIRAFVERESAFTRDVSHELRTPLAVVRSSAELLETRSELAPPAARTIRRIAAAAQDMERTIDLLFALAREERAVTERKPVELLPLIESALLDASDRFDGSAYDVEIAVPAGTTVLAGSTGLALILANLIGNAFQHARGGRLAISFANGRLSIVDDGPGIADEVIATEEVAFVKGDASAGHGLGLGIVRRLCERDGIVPDFQTSEDGTTVHLVFPPPPALGTS